MKQKKVNAENMPVGEFFSNESGDLLMLDQNYQKKLIVKEGFITPISLTHSEGSSEWSLSISHLDIDGNLHSTIHTLADLHISPKKVLRVLLDHGINLQPGAGRDFIRFLIKTQPKERALRVIKTGWLEGSWVFVQPEWTAGDAGEPIILDLEQNTPSAKSVMISGTLEEWQENVAGLLRGNHIAIFCVLTAFLGPILKILNLEGGGFNLEGPSGIGKTTGLQCAASVHGSGSNPAADSGASFTQTWNQTSNALEGVAAAHTDTLTALDEVGLYAGSDLGSDLYLLASGRGKGSMNSQRQLKNIRSWRGNILSTGEMGMQVAIERKGGKVHAGMLVRMIDIPVTNILPNPPENMTSGDFSNLTKQNCSQYFGTAGRKFIEELALALNDDQDEVILNLRAQHDEFARDLTPEGATPLQVRAIRRFAAVKVAGYAAIVAEVLPYTEQEIDECVQAVLDTWLAHRPTVTDLERALVNLQDFLVRNGQSFPLLSESNYANPKGFRDSTKGIYAFTDAQFSAATGGGNLVEVARELRRRGFLFCNEVRRLKSKLATVGDTKPRFYSVLKSFMSAELQNTDMDESVVTILD